MKKIILRSFFLAMMFVLLKPPKAAAQPFCPMWLHNNAQQIGITNDYIWSTFQEGFYYVTVFNTNFSTGETLCFGEQDQLIQITKTTSMGSIISGASMIGKGIVFNFPGPPCNGGNLPNLQMYSTSIIVRQTLGANPILAADYEYNDPSTCEYLVVPVTFSSFDAQLVFSPTRVKLDWSTVWEQDVDHFTIEKSIDGANFYKIGQVTAVGNSNSQNFYTFYDTYPSSNAYYRIVSVDIDCKRQYTAIRRVICSSGCPASFNNPSVPADCPPPQPYIWGSSLNCNYAKKAYKLMGIRGDIRVTWSLSPSYLGTLTQANRQVGITPANIPGNATLTATVVKNGITTTYNFSIAFGVPQIYAFNNVTPYNPCTGYGQLTATVSMLPGTYAWDYQWYQNGSYIGSGDHYTWMFYQGQVINYEVRYNGPCGTSSYFGSSSGGIDPWKGSPETVYQVTRNPARSSISLTRRIPPCWEPPGPVDPWPAKTSSPRTTIANSQTVTIKVFDIQGNLRKAMKVSAGDTNIQINAGDLPAGVYFVHIIEGKREEKLKVLLEK